MKAEKVLFVLGEGEENVILAPVENAVTVAMARGFTPTGDVCRTPYAREELVGQPLFADLVGPMGHGDGIVRYETVEMYALLSQ